MRGERNSWHNGCPQGKLSHAVVPGGQLAETAAAHAIVEAGQKLGTVVVEV